MLIPALPTPRLIAAVVLLAVASFPPRDAAAAECDVRLTMSDGYELEARVQTPDGTLTVQPKRVMLLLHGSGPQSMDADMTAVTRGGKKNLFFVDIADVLTREGFAVVRYNKRSYQAGISAREDRAFVAGDIYKKFAARPLHYFIQDAVDAVRWIESEFPDAEVFLLGHSQGTYVALQVAHQLPQVRGVVLIGFALQNMETLMLEQTVYRPLHAFRRADASGDDVLDAAELASPDPLAMQLRLQLGILDRDGDGGVSAQEMQAGNLSNSLLGSLGLHVFKPDEATYPQLSEILRKAEYKLLFLQGMYDNQTPPYSAMAVQMVTENVWRKTNFRFVYFPELGHALDRRERYDSLEYDVMTDEAKAALGREAREFLLAPRSREAAAGKADSSERR